MSASFRIAMVVAASLVGALPAGSVHADPLDQAAAQLTQETPYAEARQKLLAAGWLPSTFDATTIGGRCTLREEICTAYPEAESCAGTGMGFCLFRFEAPGGRKLSVTTAGEELDGLIVYGWAAE